MRLAAYDGLTSFETCCPACCKHAIAQHGQSFGDADCSFFHLHNRFPLVLGQEETLLQGASTEYRGVLWTDLASLVSKVGQASGKHCRLGE